MPLSTVFLDAGGVLVYPNWNRLSATLRSHGVHVEPDLLAAAERPAKHRLDASGTVRATNDALEELHAFHMISNLWELVPPHVPRALGALREHGLGLVVVSNANGTLRDHFRRLQLDRHFITVLDSCDEGVEKPDRRLFDIAVRKASADPETTIHVGDLYAVDIVGARAAGLRGVLLDEGWLYDGVDCPRVRSLDDLVQQIRRGVFD